MTKVILLAIIIKLSREGTAAKACSYGLYGNFEAERLQKISKKVLDKRTFMRYNIQAVTKQVAAQQDLENWTKLKLVEPWTWVWKPTINNSKFTSNSYRTQAIVSEWLQRFNAFKWRLNTIYKEFDPGSGRTLAARLTHASRTESRGACFSWFSGERVSNAWVTCPGVGDNSWKRLLIPHKPTDPHGSAGKGFIRFRMDSRPIS